MSSCCRNVIGRHRRPPAARAQIKATKEQMMFYTSGWKGERLPDGRPKLPDGLLERAKNVTIEDVWGYLR